MNRSDRNQAQHGRWQKRVLAILGGVIVVLAIWLAFALGSSNKDANKADMQPKATATKKPSKPKKLALKPGEVLGNLTERATENQDSVTGGDPTASQFYKSGNNWYWKLTSNNRGEVEVGKITGIKKSGSDYQLKTTSQVYEQGTKYTLTLHWLDKGKQEYNVHTDFKSINGNYTVGGSQTTAPQQVNTRNLTRSQIKDWIYRNIEKYGYSDESNENADDNDPNVYGYQFSFDKSGRLGVFVVENHEYVNKKYHTHYQTGSTPSVASFTITEQGYLQVHNVGTSGMEMVKNITGSSENQSAIVARTFEE
ncbi:hypothetical protein [Lentilactobacillus sp. Marseille-Q4993]|uniref:hypothetical protein n=1 Tax=Lentilactobacillus sp. Marseille-Q4993 TaxID=3039492 RepID=UPI0024BC7D72|nr:hypothetical protein [Lentilactobacillus sp. Marseille-Q4993]